MSLLVRQRKAWASRYDDAVSHNAILRRDRAAGNVAALDVLIAKLSPEEDPPAPV